MQRFQSLCLFIVSILATTSIFLPFKGIRNKTNFDVLSNYFIMKWLILGIAVVSLINIFLFFNRSLQKSIVMFLCLLVSVSAAMMFNYKEVATNDQLVFFSYIFTFPLLELILLMMAYVGIYKDDKLVKDADRLR